MLSAWTDNLMMHKTKNIGWTLDNCASSRCTRSLVYRIINLFCTGMYQLQHSQKNTNFFILNASNYYWIWAVHESQHYQFSGERWWFKFFPCTFILGQPSPKVLSDIITLMILIIACCLICLFAMQKSLNMKWPNRKYNW